MKSRSPRLHPSLRRDERGLSTVEYVIILCLIAVAGFAIWQKFGRTVEGRARGAESLIARLPMSSEP